MQSWIRLIIVSVSLAATAAFAWLAVSRAFTLPLDPTEQRLLAQVDHLAAGQPSVSADTGGADMPGLPIVVSFLSRSFGTEPWVLRFPAVLAILCAAWLAVAMVRSETANATLAVAVLGLFLGSQLLEPVSLGRAATEPVMLALALAGCASLRFQRGMGGAVIGAVLLCAAVFVHVLALCWVAAALAHLIHDDRRRALVFVLALAVVATAIYMSLARTLGPTFAAAAALPDLGFHPARGLELVGEDLLGRYGVLSLVVVLSMALPVRPWKGAGGIWTWMALAAIGEALLATQSSAAHFVALLPPALALSIAGPVAMQRVARHLSAWPGSTLSMGQGVMLAAIALQFAALVSRLPSAMQELRAG